MEANLSGQKLGQYQLTRLLGQGGMGSVYESFQASVKRKVAIKVLPAHLAKQAGYLERFQREVELAASLEHIHIMPIYDYGDSQGKSYIVMRLLTGGTLSDRLKQLGRPSAAETLILLRQIATALDYAHGRGIIHRDLKPSNIMFDDQGNAYLVDFGIAKALGSAGSGLTQTGQIVGTPSYMSPEQWTGENVDHRTDLYAFGMIAYQLLTGKIAFNADTPHAMMFKHIQEPPPRPSHLQPILNPQVDDVLLKSIAKNPADRYPAATAFVQALRPHLVNLPAQEMQVSGFMTVQVPSSMLTKQPSSPNLNTASRVRNSSRVFTAAPPPAPKWRFVPVLIGLVAVILLGLGIAAVALSDSASSAPPKPTENSAVVLATTTDSEVEVAALTTEEATETIPTLAPTHTDTPSPEPSVTNTASPSATETATKTFTPTATNTLTATPSPTKTPSRTPTRTPRPSNTPRSSVLLKNVSIGTGGIAVYQLPTTDSTRLFAAAGGFAPHVAGKDSSEDWLYLYYFEAGEWQDGWARTNQLTVSAADLARLPSLNSNNIPLIPDNLTGEDLASRPQGVAQSNPQATDAPQTTQRFNVGDHVYCSRCRDTFELIRISTAPRTDYCPPEYTQWAGVHVDGDPPGQYTLCENTLTKVD